MVLNIIILVLSIIIAGLSVWIVTSNKYKKRIQELENQNSALISQTQINENIINSVKNEFTKIAQDSLKNQQEQLLSAHSTDLLHRFEIFKSEEINPVNKMLKDFKEAIDTYQKSHEIESIEIKNAVSTAEKYAKALTTNQNLKGEFGEHQLEQILKFSGLVENIHYTKQFVSGNAKPDFVINLPEGNHLIIDSKVILKNFIEYANNDFSSNYKKDFYNDLTNCIINLAKKNYEEIEGLNQPDFILMFIPIENCINLIYSDYDFQKAVELASSKNIIMVGMASLLVTLRLVNQLWATKNKTDNIENIITAGENLYNNITLHCQGLLNIKQSIENASIAITTEINRFTHRNNGSIFKEAEKLKEYGIEAKSTKSGKKIVQNTIPDEFLSPLG